MSDDIENWVIKNWNGGKNYFMEWEKNDMLRLVSYLREIDIEKYGINKEEGLNNFKSFYTQYDIRRNKNLLLTFPQLNNLK